LAVAVIADRTEYTIQYSYIQTVVWNISVVSMSILFTVSNRSLLLMSVDRRFVAKQIKTIHHTTKVSEEVNRKRPARNTTVQLSTPYTDPEHRSAQYQTDRQTHTDRRHHHDNLPRADHTGCSTIGIVQNCQNIT